MPVNEKQMIRIPKKRIVALPRSWMWEDILFAPQVLSAVENFLNYVLILSGQEYSKKKVGKIMEQRSANQPV